MHMAVRSEGWRWPLYSKNLTTFPRVLLWLALFPLVSSQPKNFLLHMTDESFTLRKYEHCIRIILCFRCFCSSPIMVSSCLAAVVVDQALVPAPVLVLFT